MKLSVYEPNKHITVQLKLEENENGVKLTAVDSQGGWERNLLLLSNDGTIHLFSGIGDKYGFELDENGYIKIRY